MFEEQLSEMIINYKELAILCPSFALFKVDDF